MTVTIPRAKAQMRAELEALAGEFLEFGGRVTHCPGPKTKAPCDWRGLAQPQAQVVDLAAWVRERLAERG